MNRNQLMGEAESGVIKFILYANTLLFTIVVNGYFISLVGIIYGVFCGFSCGTPGSLTVATAFLPLPLFFYLIHRVLKRLLNFSKNIYFIISIPLFFYTFFFLIPNIILVYLLLIGTIIETPHLLFK